MSASRHGGQVFAAARSQGVAPSRILDFSANINPLGPSPKALLRLRRDLNLIRFYPDTESRELRDLVAESETIDRNCILFGNGATHLLHLIPRSLKPRKALIAEPSFAEYGAALKAAGCKIHPVALQCELGFRLERKPLFDAIRRECPDLVLLGHPNNPTGSLVSSSLVSELIDFCTKKQIYLVLDESFIDFTGRHSCTAEASRRPYLLVVRSLTKFWALAGLRIGYLVAQDHLIETLSTQMEPWSVNCLALAAAAESLKDVNYRRETLALIRREREFLFGRLSRLNWLRPYPSEANFLLVELAKTGLSSTDLKSTLERRNILIRDASDFPGLSGHHVRLAVRNRQDNRRLIKELCCIGSSLQYSGKGGL